MRLKEYDSDINQKDEENIINTKNSSFKRNNDMTRFIIDKNNSIKININGIKTKKDITKIKLNKLNLGQENKLKYIYDLNQSNNRYININDLINDLYNYKIKYQELKNIIENKNENGLIIKQFNLNLSNIKKEKEILNNKKKFLINELTKSIYNNDKLQKKYKNEFERIDSYINKLFFDLNQSNN